MRRNQVIALILAAGAIFTFVALTADVQAIGNLEEKIREVQNNEGFMEAGGTPSTAEQRREAGEWQREVGAAANERDREFEIYMEPPEVDEIGRETGVPPTPEDYEGEYEAEDAAGSLEELREGPLNNRGGGSGGCDYSGGWCPPSCMSCSPPAY